MTTRRDYAEAVLVAGGWPVRLEAELALVAVMLGEDSHAECNPLDTEEPASGSWRYNSAGVRNYTSMAQGVGAVVATLTNGDYPGVIAALADPSAKAEAIVDAWAASPWGTWSAPGPARADLSTVVASWPAYGNVQITCPAPPPAPIGDDMVATDPISHGVWVARPDGAVYAFGGAPYLGGLNNHPEWGRGGSGQPGCVGIAYDYATKGYVLAVDGDGLTDPEVYRFPRTGIYA